MIHGETVSVSYRTFGQVDECGNEEESYSEPTEVENVLVGRGETIDLIEDGQPYAVRADKRFCFPRGFAGDLRGALITREGVTYKVMGEPTSITDANIPGSIPWNVRVEARAYDG